MTKEIEYLNNNRNSKKTPLEIAADRIIANREKAWIAKEKQLEAFYNHEHKQRIEAIPMNQRTWSDVNLMESIRKSETEPEHYYDIGKTIDEENPNAHSPDTRTSSDLMNPHQNDSAYKLKETITEYKKILDIVKNSEKGRSIPGLQDKIDKCQEIISRFESAISEGFTNKSIQKSFKGYKKPCSGLLNKGKYIKKSCNDYKCITKDYVHMPKVDSGYEKQELIDVRDEINKVLSDLENFDRL